MVVSDFGNDSRNPWTRSALCQQFRLLVGVKWCWERFLGISVDHHLNATTYLSIVVNHVHPFIFLSNVLQNTKPVSDCFQLVQLTRYESDSTPLRCA